MYYSCRVFHSAIRSGSFPKLADFEYALLNVFGYAQLSLISISLLSLDIVLVVMMIVSSFLCCRIVVERYDYKVDLIPTVKMYYEIATNAFKGISSCAQKYPCSNDQIAAGKKRQSATRHSLKLPSAESNRTRTATTKALINSRNRSNSIQAKR